MKPAEFDYFAAHSVKDAVAFLIEHPDDARVIAGGQSLVPLMNFRLARPGWLVDINRIQELDYIHDEGSFLSIGALTREYALESADLIQTKCPILAEATRWIGHPAIRHRGTIGGSLAHNDPSAEYPVIGALLDVQVIAQGSSGNRSIPFKDFGVSYFTTSLQAGEIVVEVQVPVQKPGTGVAFKEVARRHGDFALVSVGAMLRMDGDVVQEARLAMGGVGPTALRAPAAEALLCRQVLDGEVIAAAAELAAAAAEPPSDMHGSAEFRRELCEVLATRCLEEARANARA
jgi:CO/xanthine dehydrogenase FAD-binding subunit